MPERRFPEIADIADRVKRRLFNRLRDATQSINYLDYQEYKRAFGAIPDLLLAEWAKIREELKEEPKLRERLRGYLFEALFYYACLDVQASFMDADLAEFGGAEFGESAPWFEATPLYDIIPTLHHVKEGKIRKRRVPQTGADFLITYVGDSGPLAPSLVDVKSVKPKDWDSKSKALKSRIQRDGDIVHVTGGLFSIGSLLLCRGTWLTMLCCMRSLI